MAAYGAELISVPAGKMEMARDLAAEMAARGEGIVLDQFGNLDNPLAHYRGTGGCRAGCRALRSLWRCTGSGRRCCLPSLSEGGLYCQVIGEPI